MVSYTEFIEAGHEVYQEKGGRYQEGTAAELVQLLAEFWQRNKEQLKAIGYREAKRVIDRNLNV